MVLQSRVLLLLLTIKFVSPLSDCLHDTHIECGELVTWNDTATPSSTVLEITFPTVQIGANWSVHLTTCHERTSASTTLKLFDACPAGGSDMLRSAVGSNSRDTQCSVADRSSTLDFHPHMVPFPTQSKGYFVVVSAGAAAGPNRSLVNFVVNFVVLNPHERRINRKR
jgi:hypothetical protein